jgi:hypothetical protein
MANDKQSNDKSVSVAELKQLLMESRKLTVEDINVSNAKEKVSAQRIDKAVNESINEINARILELYKKKDKTDIEQKQLINLLDKLKEGNIADVIAKKTEVAISSSKLYKMVEVNAKFAKPKVANAFLNPDKAIAKAIASTPIYKRINSVKRTVNKKVDTVKKVISNIKSDVKSVVSPHLTALKESMIGRGVTKFKNSKMMQSITGFFEPKSPFMKTLTKVMTKVIGPLALLTFILSPAGITILMGLLAFFKVKVFEPYILPAWNAIKSFIDDVKPVVIKIFEWTKIIFDTIKNMITTLFSPITTLVKKMYGWQAAKQEEEETKKATQLSRIDTLEKARSIHSSNIQRYGDKYKNDYEKALSKYREQYNVNEKGISDEEFQHRNMRASTAALREVTSQYKSVTSGTQPSQPSQSDTQPSFQTNNPSFNSNNLINAVREKEIAETRAKIKETAEFANRDGKISKFEQRTMNQWDEKLNKLLQRQETDNIINNVYNNNAATIMPITPTPLHESSMLTPGYAY